MEYFLTYEEMLRAKFSHLEKAEREEKVKEHLRIVWKAMYEQYRPSS